MKIKVDTDNLMSRYNEINDSLDDYANAILGIKNATDEMAFSWKGESYDTFNTKMQGLIKDLNKLDTSLEEFNEFINSYIVEINKIDNIHGSKRVRLQ